MSWTPPESPDPSEILNSARADALAGAHADALAKFLWFHHNALQIDPAFTGVRLSFALADWLRLADVYPPARTAFVRLRDETAAAFRVDPSSFDLFHDLASLNQSLGDEHQTADVFGEVARQQPDDARRLYQVAEPSLIAARRYEECGPFLDPSQRLWLARESYQSLSEFEETMQSGENPPPRLAGRMYMHDVATLVALLALTARHDEAEGARGEALTLLDDDEFRAILDAAMTGHLPTLDDE